MWATGNNNNQRGSEDHTNQGESSPLYKGKNKQFKIIDILLGADVNVIQFKDITWFLAVETVLIIAWHWHFQWSFEDIFQLKYWISELWCQLKDLHWEGGKGNTQPVDHYNYLEMKQNFNQTRAPIT